MGSVRKLIAIYAAAATVGCHTSQTVNLVENPDQSTRPAKIEIATAGGSKQVIYRPVVRGDSLYGSSDDERDLPVAISLRDISRATTRHFSGPRTALLVAGTAVAAVAAWVVVLIIMIDDPLVCC